MKTSRIANKKARTRTPSRASSPTDVAPFIASSALHPALCSYLGYCLSRSAIRMRTALEENLRPLGLIPPHLGLLVILDAGGALNQLRLGEEMGVDKATMVGLIDDLENLDLVERVASSEDRRVKFVKITGRGRKMKTRAVTIAKKVETRFLSSLTRQETQALRSALPKLVRQT